MTPRESLRGGVGAGAVEGAAVVDTEGGGVRRREVEQQRPWVPGRQGVNGSSANVEIAAGENRAR
jgi:hypothetical protein